MNARCAKFWEDGQKLLERSAQSEGNKEQVIIKIRKETRTLSRFLYKNQSSRFDEAAQSKVLDTVASYIAYGNQLASSSCLDHPMLMDDLLKLVNDGLAMPFNVISTKQKKKLLKWHEELSRLAPLKADMQAEVAAKCWTVIAIDDDGYLSLYDEETEEIAEDLAVPKSSELFCQIRSAIDRATVIVTVAGGEIASVRIEGH